jgi:hypothetical protein
MINKYLFCDYEFNNKTSELRPMTGGGGGEVNSIP